MCPIEPEDQYVGGGQQPLIVSFMFWFQVNLCYLLLRTFYVKNKEQFLGVFSFFLFGYVCGVHAQV